MGGPGPGRSSSVRGAGLAVDVGVECSWHSHVEVFQHTLSARWAPVLVHGRMCFCCCCCCGGEGGNDVLTLCWLYWEDKDVVAAMLLLAAEALVACGILLAAEALVACGNIVDCW